MSKKQESDRAIKSNKYICICMIPKKKVIAKIKETQVNRSYLNDKEVINGKL